MGWREEVEVCSPIPSVESGEVGGWATADAQEFSGTINSVCYGKEREATQQKAEEDGSWSSLPASCVHG